jgi:hypothetical protein
MWNCRERIYAFLTVISPLSGGPFEWDEFIESSAKRSNLGVGFEKGLGRKSPQGTYDSGLDRMDLLEEKRVTAPNLIGLRIPILGGTAFDDVCNIDDLPLKMDGLEDVGQELASLSYKRLPLNILFISGAFTDDHEFGLFVPLSENKGVSGPMEFTSLAIPHLRSYRF